MSLTDTKKMPRVETLTTPELARYLALETHRFQSQGTSNGAYGIELFRRALTEGDDKAWNALYQQFQPLVLAWITQYPAVIPLLNREGPEGLIHASFVKFWQSLSKPGKMEGFDSLASLLKYFKCTVRSVVTDALRQQAHYDEETLDFLDGGEGGPRTEENPEDTVLDAASAQDLWQTIQEEVSNEGERLLLYLIYIQGMRPREICNTYHCLFPTVDEVYRIRRNVLMRLRRNQRIQMLA